MTWKVALWLAISIAFEAAGDVLVKLASVQGARLLWCTAFCFYAAMLLAWFAAIADAKAITVPGIVWLLAGQIALVVIGCGAFGERLTLVQRMGAVIAMPALVMLCL